MASTIPTQERVVDPFASYNSNIVNQITEIVTQGDEGLLTPNSMQVTIDSISRVAVSTGYAMKDDVLINITAEHIVDFTDTSQYISDPLPFTGGYYYLVLNYQYLKQRPAPQASIVILQPTERGLITSGSTYLLLKVVELDTVGPHSILNIYDSDPEPAYENNARTYLRYYAGAVSFLPTFEQTRDQGRIVYDVTDDAYYYGYASGWSKAASVTSGQLSATGWLYDSVTGYYYFDIDTSFLNNNAFLSSWFDNSTGYQVSPTNVQILNSGNTLRVYFNTNTLTIDYIIQG